MSFKNQKGGTQHTCKVPDFPNSEMVLFKYPVCCCWSFIIAVFLSLLVSTHCHLAQALVEAGTRPHLESHARLAPSPGHHCSAASSRFIVLQMSIQLIHYPNQIPAHFLHISFLMSDFWALYYYPCLFLS